MVGLAWSGVVWVFLECSRMVSCGRAWSGMVWRGVTWCGAALGSLAWFAVVWISLAWPGVFGVAWCFLAPFGVIQGGL